MADCQQPRDLAYCAAIVAWSPAPHPLAKPPQHGCKDKSNEISRSLIAKEKERMEMEVFLYSSYTFSIQALPFLLKQSQPSPSFPIQVLPKFMPSSSPCLVWDFFWPFSGSGHYNGHITPL
ncbi:hypothetical protein NQZ68_000670 [Dissostichus eleginoides]|nr:hypothetical protein NQZ68_000670 [Dissostichus eleginoides]